MGIYYFSILMFGMVLIGIYKFRSSRKKAAPGKNILTLESKKTNNSDTVFSKEIEKIKCKEIIRK